MAEAAIQAGEAERESLGQSSAAQMRKMGSGAVFLFTFCSMGLTYFGLLPFSTFAGLWPGTNLVMAISAAAIVAFIFAYLYAVIGTLAPRYGADYVVGSRVLGGPLAFASSLLMMVAMAMFGGLIVASVVQQTVPMFARILAVITGNNAYLNVLNYVASANGVVMLGTFGVIAVFFMLLLPPRMSRFLMFATVILTVFALGTVYLQLASAQPADFQAAWEKFMGGGSYLNNLFESRNRGMHASFSPVSTLTAGLAFGFWLLFGYFNTTFIAQDAKKPGRSLFLGSSVALLVGWGILALGAFLVQRLASLEWIAAASYLNQFADFNGAAMPWLPFYGAILHPDPALTWMIGIAWLFAQLVLAQALLYSASRIPSAWAEDSLIHPQISFVHPDLGSPVVSILFVSLIAEFSVVFAALAGGMEKTVNPVFLIAAAQIVPVLAVIVLPFRKKEWFKNAAPLARLKVGPLPVASFAGLLCLAYLVWTIYTSAVLPAYISMNTATLIVLGVVLLAGLLYFILRRFGLKASGEKQSDPTENLPSE